MSYYIYQIDCLLKNLIKNKKKVDFCHLETLCLDVLKVCNEDEVSKLVNFISRTICDLLALKGIEALKIGLYMFNPFCYQELRNLIKKKYNIEFQQKTTSFYSLVNLKKMKEDLLNKKKSHYLLNTIETKNTSENEKTENLSNFINSNFDGNIILNDNNLLQVNIKEKDVNNEIIEQKNN